MPKVKYGEWEIDVDIETTKKYYDNFTVQNADSQAYRNYLEHCKNLTEQENAFFQSLGIKPECCNVSAFYLTVDNNCPTVGSYCFVGKFLNKPEEMFMTAEEFAENNYVWNLPDTRVHIDRYIFTFIDPEAEFPMPAFNLENIPDGFIRFNFSGETIPWLLDEQFEGKIFDPNNMESYYSTPEEIEESKQRIKDGHESFKGTFVQMFRHRDTGYIEMPQSEIEDYSNRWFEEIVPKHNQEKARGHCFSDVGGNRYLWHAFSSGDAPCIDGDDARFEFEAVKRGEAVLIINKRYTIIGYPTIDENTITVPGTGYIIENAGNITVKDMDAFQDIILTGKDFEWCYVHTHESDCGPYFYQKNKTFLKLNDEAVERIWADDYSAYCEIFKYVRGTYCAVFYRRDYDNFGNPFYRGFYSGKRVIGDTPGETVEKARRFIYDT